MTFEVSELIHTTKSRDVVLEELVSQLQKISQRVVRTNATVVATDIEASFGSINRSDTTTFYAIEREQGILCVADVNYRPSGAFWVILIITLFTYIFWLIPIIFYLTQKRTVRSAIEDVFRRVKNECESGEPVINTIALRNSVYCSQCGANWTRTHDLKFCSRCGSPIGRPLSIASGQ